MEKDKIKNSLICEISKLIDVIRNEYSDFGCDMGEYDLEKLVHIEELGTVSLFVRNKNFYFPMDVYKVLKFLRYVPGFGMMKNHTTCTDDNMIINNNTYVTYVKHAFLKGLTLEEYFKEILLHETLHFCGGGGGLAIREGINELKTRQLAKKYGLLTSFCGYPNETRIAYELEKMFGEDVMNRILFAKNNKDIKSILDSVSFEASSFFFELQDMMEKEFHNKYMKYKFPGLFGPIIKIFRYKSIDYANVYELIDKYRDKF